MANFHINNPEINPKTNPNPYPNLTLILTIAISKTYNLNRAIKFRDY